MWTAIQPSLIAAALLLAVTLPARAQVLAPFTATYSAYYGIFSVGKMKFELSRENGCWRWHGVIDPSGLAALIAGTIVEDSYFCVVDGALQPQSFSHREAGDANDSFRLEFNWPEGLVSYNGGPEYQVPGDVIDPFLLYLAARIWLEDSDDPATEPPREFVLADEDRIKRYRLAVSEGRRVKVPAGKFETVRIARVDDDDKQIVFWAAPALDFLPVLVERTDGGTTLRLELRSVKREPNRVIKGPKESAPPMS